MDKQINKKPWLERKVNDLVNVLIALAGLGDIGLILFLPTMPGFSFNNFFGYIFFISLINLIATAKLLPFIQAKD